MSGPHTLVLPLPPTYAVNAREHFSFFTTPAAPDDTDHLSRYLDDLCAFLRRTRLIQRHPDKYFQYVRGERWRTEALHLDGSPVTKEELDDTNHLCDAFAPLIDGGEQSLSAIRQLLREGPPSSADPCLAEFYGDCRRLMLHRIPRPDNDSASFTLLQDAAQRSARAQQRADDVAQEARRRQILQLVLSYGMSAKKQHEVVIMRDTIRDLVDCTNIDVRVTSPSTSASSPPQPPDLVRTVVNVGEGKGYVSRALALCDGLHVVGLDCNPAHRERAMERFETLVESSLRLRPAVVHGGADRSHDTVSPAVPQVDNNPCGKDMISLLYEPRGAIVSVACRVDANTQWKSILQGHTPTVDDGAPMPGNVRMVTDENDNDKPSLEAHTHGLDLILSPDRKGRCKVCGRVFPLDKALYVVKHIHRHTAKRDLDVATASEQPCQLPSLEEVSVWQRDLPQAQLQTKLIDAFFEPVDFKARQGRQPCDGDLSTAAADEAQPSATPSEPTEASADDKPHTPCLRESQGDVPDSAHKRPRTADDDEADFPVARIARGRRVVVLTPRTAADVTNHGGGAPVSTPAEHRRYVITTLTVVGRDDATDTHTVIDDERAHKERCRLVRLPPEATSRAGKLLQTCVTQRDGERLAADLRLPSAATWAALHQAVVLHVLEPFTVTAPAVRVPSLSNTVFVGLHTCGDLGANTCRLFVQNRARGLLLVSCCWHALTPQGFPLSEAFRRRGMTTDKVSLLLATQPLDMWATASAEGHRSSARLLFFRTLLIMLWDTLRTEWHAETEANTPADSHDGEGHSCPFAPEPHLEPGFLRRMNKVKETVAFPEFANHVCAEYIYAATAKQNAYTWHTTVCESCRVRQEALFRDRLQRVSTELANKYMPTHFPRFLGLTVLRMWMCHLVESLFLLDRAIFLHEALSQQGGRSSVSLVPLFDGATSPRMYGILARRDVCA